MLSVGVDIIEVARIEGLLARQGERFCNRCFTPQEQAYCQGNVARLAGRFAIKEAVAKALGTGIGDFTWTDIEIVADERGKPELRLYNKAHDAAETLGLRHWSISLSHAGAHAIGFAVGMKG